VIAIALLIGAEPVSQSMLAAADDANGTYVQCLFATSRAASAGGLSVQAFERQLATACRSEAKATVRAGAAILVARGESDAVSSSRRVADEARRSVLDTYRRIRELSGEQR
jgi:hypothetical protein